MVPVFKFYSLNYFLGLLFAQPSCYVILCVSLSSYVWYLNLIDLISAIIIKPFHLKASHLPASHSSLPFIQVSPHPRSRWSVELARPPPGETSQDSGVPTARSSQDSAPLPPPGALRTKSEALEQRIEQERQQRRQLERDLREALTVVAAHVQVSPGRIGSVGNPPVPGVTGVGFDSNQSIRQQASSVSDRTDGMWWKC